MVFRQVVAGRDLEIVDPVIETISIGAEDFLDATDAQVVRQRLHARNDLRFEHSRLPVELWVQHRLGAQPHCEGKLRGHGANEGGHLDRVGELLLEVLDLTQQIAIVILQGAGSLR